MSIDLDFVFCKVILLFHFEGKGSFSILREKFCVFHFEGNGSLFSILRETEKACLRGKIESFQKSKNRKFSKLIETQDNVNVDDRSVDDSVADEETELEKSRGHLS